MGSISNKKIRVLNPNIENKKYHHIFEQSPIAIELYDYTGKLVDANQAFLDLFGVKNTEVVKGFNLFTDMNLPQQAINDVQAGKSVKYEFAFDFDHVKEKKLYDTSRVGTCYLECYINPINNKKGETAGYIAHITEITDRKQAETLLKKQANELQYLNVAKDEFLSLIAHDLKNPFNAIIGFSDLMLNNFSSLDDQTLHKGLTTIKNASTHAYKLLENLLIWSRNQSGRNTFNPEVLNLKTRIAEVLKLAEGSANNKDIHLTANIRKNYPVYFDKNMIDTILTNLISNAIKYSYKGGKVKVSATHNNNSVEISVSDNGIGISPDIINAIFEIDKRANTPGTADEQGTGLGLILCKDFLTKHDGQIRVESSQGKGSRFTFSLPLFEKQKPV